MVKAPSRGTPELTALIRLYQERLLKSFEAIGTLGIENETAEILRNLLTRAQENLVNRWKTGRKYLRTVSAMRIMPDYPEGVVELSLTLDATVNILDDLLDETLTREVKGLFIGATYCFPKQATLNESLTKEEKALYVVELLRLISNYTLLEKDIDTRTRVFDYYHKLIAVAVMEEVYYSRMKAAGDMEELLSNARGVYGVRSRDMDIFIEIPLLRLKRNGEEIADTVRLARTFRCLNLVKKDIDDYGHDTSMGADTTITMLYRDKRTFRKVVEELVDSYMKESESFKGSCRYRGRLAEIIASERDEILRRL